MNKYQRDSLRQIAKIPAALVTKAFYIELHKFLLDIAKVVIAVSLAFMLLGQVTKLGHGDQEYQNQHTGVQWQG